AILAVLTILVWHFYFTIFAPDAYPLSWTWLTGKISSKEFKEHHSLEYRRTVGLSELTGTDEEEGEE
ncbi:MAG: hypothetical protein HY706_09710, partial [Candidatus Hydrogenedentes bacterium]|nr:hypothetical protein [Candidatus Hydrogenedentota bacterium]